MFFAPSPDGPVDWDLVALSDGQAQIGYVVVARSPGLAIDELVAGNSS